MRTVWLCLTRPRRKPRPRRRRSRRPGKQPSRRPQRLAEDLDKDNYGLIFIMERSDKTYALSLVAVKVSLENVGESHVRKLV